MTNHERLEGWRGIYVYPVTRVTRTQAHYKVHDTCTQKIRRYIGWNGYAVKIPRFDDSRDKVTVSRRTP